jgi:hypothetical protein
VLILVVSSGLLAKKLEDHKQDEANSPDGPAHVKESVFSEFARPDSEGDDGDGQKDFWQMFHSLFINLLTFLSTDPN